MENKIGSTKPGMARSLVIIGLAFISLSLVFSMSCSSSKPTTTPPITQTVEVTIQGFAFLPQTITIPLNTEVIWTHQDNPAHTVTSDTDLFHSGGLEFDDTFSYTFTQAGVFLYHCTPHPWMTGTVIVE